MSRPDKFPECMALSSKREACLGYRETFTKLDLAEKEIKRLRAALLECKHGAEYPDELGDIIDAALSAE